MTRKEWLEKRRKAIGSSDAAAILGLSPWKSAMDIFLEKTGLIEEQPDPQREFLLDLGSQLEPVIAHLYEKQTARQLKGNGITFLLHREYPNLGASPDRFVVGEARGVELKTENQFQDEFGEPGTDQVPYHYLIQCAMCMAVTNLPVWDVALLHGGVAFDIYTIERDLELERDMIDQLCEWWDHHIIGKTPPDIDGGSGWKVYLRQKFPRDILPVMEADTETHGLINNLRVVKQILKEYVGIESELENRLKLVIGEHEGIAGQFGRITWKKAKDTQVVDWQSLALELGEKFGMTPERMADMVRGFSEAKHGARRFLFSPREEWAYGAGEQGELASGEGPAALPGDGGGGGSGTSGSDH
jgi:putative phage-type endonuclease